MANATRTLLTVFTSAAPPASLFTSPPEQISLPHLLASLLLLLTTYIYRLSFLNPSPTAKPHKTIRDINGIMFLFDLWRQQDVLFGLCMSWIYLLEALHPTYLHTICPTKSTVLSVSPLFWALLLTTIAATAVRLSCMHRLGPRFTFVLSAPKKLETGGFYRYLQHPSYTALDVSMVAYYTLQVLFCAGGILQCYFGESQVRVFVARVSILKALVMVPVTMARLPREERMLEETFGEEWRVWSRKTKRMIPFVW